MKYMNTKFQVLFILFLLIHGQNFAQYNFWKYDLSLNTSFNGSPGWYGMQGGIFVNKNYQITGAIGFNRRQAQLVVGNNCILLDKKKINLLFGVEFSLGIPSNAHFKNVNESYRFGSNLFLYGIIGIKYYIFNHGLSISNYYGYKWLLNEPQIKNIGVNSSLLQDLKNEIKDGFLISIGLNVPLVFN